MNAADAKAITDFAVNVLAIVQAEPNKEGIHGCLIGIGIGGMMGHGATEKEVREVFEQTLQGVIKARSQLSKESG